MSALDGKEALVTGAGRGVGRDTALELARAGARVALLARSGDELQESAGRVREFGGTAFVVQADLGDLDGLAEIARRVNGAVGSVDILINNAATAEAVGASVSLDPAAWAAALTVNVVAPATLAFCLLPAMLERRWGRVVNVSSGIVEEPGAIIRANAYVTSKAALEAHTLNLAAELADSGVTVNVFRPGSVDTAMFDLMCDSPAMIGNPELREWALRTRADGELTTPDESARSLVARLHTDSSGQIWDVSDVL
jgi:NAD(P)-dependent dehydrogenase (short-subunit alcohol dehydrogenase family)